MPLFWFAYYFLWCVNWVEPPLNANRILFQLHSHHHAFTLHAWKFLFWLHKQSLAASKIASVTEVPFFVAEGHFASHFTELLFWRRWTESHSSIPSLTILVIRPLFSMIDRNIFLSFILSLPHVFKSSCGGGWSMMHCGEISGGIYE